MKTNLKILIISSLAAFLFFSCKEDEVITIANAGASINFPKIGYSNEFKDDHLEFLSVYYHGGESQVQTRFAAHMSGTIVDYDREYLVRVIPDSTATPLDPKYYTVPEVQIMPAGVYQDYVYLTINNDLLKADKAVGTIYIQHVANDNFTLGLDEYTFMEVYVNGQGMPATAPPFWNNNKLNDYGGTYNSIKAEKFVEIAQVDSEMWKAKNSAVLYSYAKKTHEWFEENPTYDQDNVRIHFTGTIPY